MPGLSFAPHTKAALPYKAGAPLWIMAVALPQKLGQLHCPQNLGSYTAPNNLFRVQPTHLCLALALHHTQGLPCPATQVHPSLGQLHSPHYLGSYATPTNLPPRPTMWCHLRLATLPPLKRAHTHNHTQEVPGPLRQGTLARQCTTPTHVPPPHTFCGVRQGLPLRPPNPTTHSPKGPL